MIAETEEVEDAKSLMHDSRVNNIGCGSLYLSLKRVFDVVISVALAVVLAIPMLLVGLVIRLESEGPAIFTQKRMGKDGEIFTIYKFRTMYISAPPEKASSLFQDSDDYVTKIGTFLRRTSIDEIPQLFNVIKGDMSLVGYRPVCLTEVKLNRLRAEYGVFVLRPGITGLAQVRGRDGVGYKDKAKYDAEYVEKCSFKMDLWCLIMTAKTVLSGEGVK